MAIFDNKKADSIERQHGGVIDLRSHMERKKIEEQQRQRDQAIAEEQVESQGQFCAVEISLNGNPVPTHLKVHETGDVYLIMPHEVINSMMDQAFDVGFKMALRIYREQIVRAVVGPQLSYCQMVVNGGLQPDGSNLSEFIEAFEDAARKEADRSRNNA